MMRKSLFYGFLLMLSFISILNAFEEDEIKRYILQKRAKAVVVQQQTTVPSKDVGKLLRCVGDFCRTEDITTSYKTFISLLANHHAQQKTLLTKEDIASQKIANASLEKALSDLWGVTGRQGLSVVGSVLRTTGGWFCGGTTRVSSILANYWVEREVQKEPHDVIVLSLSSLLSVADEKIVPLSEIPNMILDLISKLMKRRYEQFHAIIPFIPQYMIEGLVRHLVYKENYDKFPKGTQLSDLNRTFLKQKSTEVNDWINRFEILSTEDKKPFVVETIFSNLSGAIEQTKDEHDKQQDLIQKSDEEEDLKSSETGKIEYKQKLIAVLEYFIKRSYHAIKMDLSMKQKAESKVRKEEASLGLKEKKVDSFKLEDVMIDVPIFEQVTGNGKGGTLDDTVIIRDQLLSTEGKEVSRKDDGENLKESEKK